MKNHNYCIILAGGIGSRLWPVSRSTRPKQFLDLFGTGRTLLQQTYDRVSHFIDPERIYVCTNFQYLPLVYEQLPQVDDVHILEEPLRRGTLASVAWGAVVINKEDPDAKVFITPSDQLILNEDLYQEDILNGLSFVGVEKRLLVMGIRPTRPDTGYGYIQMGEPTDVNGISKVKTFTEKPERVFAEMFLKEGNFLWNTGLHVARVDTLLDTFTKFVPEYQIEIPRMKAEAETADPKLVPEFFQVLPNLSLDTGILERTGLIYVQECHFGWADIGTWNSISDYAPTDAHGNVLMNTKAILYNCEDNIVRMPDGRKAVIKGLKGYVVAEEGEILMICPREDVATMRKMHTDTKFS